MKMRHIGVLFGIALGSSSVVQAADTIVMQEVSPAVPSAVVPSYDLPYFSWGSLYFGIQGGGFSSKISLDRSVGDGWEAVPESATPKLSGFFAGGYLGANIDLGNSIVVGAESDLMWAGKKDEKSLFTKTMAAIREEARKEMSGAGVNSGGSALYSYTIKEKWIGSTRARVGFSLDNMMPYITGGISYGQIQGIGEFVLNETAEQPAAEVASPHLAEKTDETKVMVGYAVGAGVDLAVADNIVLRTEYRYSDLGKKKFANNEIDMQYKTNDFRVGIAYKF
ncbi:outer membrane protein [Bartonella ancashensis]|uniref:Hemin binding protein c n=1 Tax=Bartonella ancashensis TaxID=1318743 RepID=A0A0M5KWX9_9HYPH|nr:outer membrane protein [Bartonella ancashensis]ALE03460.1 Hemin binding protein c [Bartonella ancashensis]